MSQPRRNSSTITRAILLGLVGVFLLFLDLIPVIVVVPILIYYIWDNLDKRKELERRVAELEGALKINRPLA